VSLLLIVEKKDRLSPPDSPTPYDLDRVLVEAAEEIEFDWPEFLPVERIKAGITEIALGFLLFAGLVGLLWLPLNPNPHFSRPVRSAHSVPTFVGVSCESIRPGKLLPKLGVWAPVRSTVICPLGCR
jgi:hypothetical protein